VNCWMEHPKSGRAPIGLLVICFISAICAYPLYSYLWTSAHVMEEEQKIVTLFDEIDPGIPLTELEDKIKSVGFTDDQYWIDRDLGRGGIKTSWKLGQKNWIVVFSFSGEALISAKVRTNNNIHERPTAAPPDIVSSTVERGIR